MKIFSSLNLTVPDQFLTENNEILCLMIQNVEKSLFVIGQLRQILALDWLRNHKNSIQILLYYLTINI